MGLIYAIPEKACGMIEEIWENYIFCNNLPSGSLENGTRIVLAENQTLLLLSDGKIVDCAVIPGGYIYHSAVEANMLSLETAERVAGIREEFAEEFSEEVTGAVTAQILSFEQGTKHSFTFNDVAFHDAEYNIDITLQGSGTFTIGMGEPLVYYLKSKKQDADSPKEEDFVKALVTVIGELGEVGIRYDQLAYTTDRMVSPVNALLKESWKKQLGVEVKEIAFSSVMPNEEGFQKIIQAKKAKEEAQRKARELQEAAAEAERKAAEARRAEEMRQAEQARREENLKVAMENATNTTHDSRIREERSGLYWICNCGRTNTNTAKFCPQCGSQKPVIPVTPPNSATNEKRFCPKCGLDVSDRARDLKFCPQCGREINGGAIKGNVLHDDTTKWMLEEDIIYKVGKAKFADKPGRLCLKQGLLVFEGAKKELICELGKIQNPRVERQDLLEITYPSLWGGYGFVCENPGEWVTAIIRAKNGSYPPPVNMSTNSAESYIYLMKDELSKPELARYYMNKTGVSLTEANNVVNRILGDVF